MKFYGGGLEMIFERRVWAKNGHICLLRGRMIVYR